MIMAEEHLASVSEIAVGNGRLKRGDAARIMKDWQKQAKPQQERMKPKTPEDFKIALASMGISMQRVVAE